jgi:hypothetical protein
MAVSNAAQRGRTVSDPCSSYESISPLWGKSRAVCNGERFVKDYDGVLDVSTFTNLLLPFSPSMTEKQYKFYKAEAELPGIVAQYAKVIVGGLLRKEPQIELPKEVPEEAMQWIKDAFSQDNSPLIAFLDRALWEEMQTSRAWVYVDYPKIPKEKRDKMVAEDFKKLKPYPVLWNAESVINWKVGISSENGHQELTQLIVRNYVEEPNEEGFHPDLVDTVWVHEIVEGFYQIRKYQKTTKDGVIPVVNGTTQQVYKTGGTGGNSKGDAPGNGFELKETITEILANGERLKVIPAWPLNGSIHPIEPVLTPLVDREISLYNKVSRRNHLLYGAATYTPVIASDMADDDFEKIVEAGLGAWIHIRREDKATVLETPTAALQDMEKAIVATIEEMAKMGIRMLSPENVQSGVALDIRNAAQTAQLGTLNSKISAQMSDIIAFMINWRYGLQITSADVHFELSSDFNPVPLGADWLRLATEWYEKGLIPRSLWLIMLKMNDMVPPDYKDEEGIKEINNDELIANKAEADAFAKKLASQSM